MDDFMDVTCGITGMAELNDKQIECVVPKVKQEVENAIKGGYKIFWLAVVGNASLHYAKGVLEAIQGRDGITLEVMIPYPAWDNAQPNKAEYYKLVANSNGREYAHGSPEDEPVMFTNNRVLDLSTRMIVVSDGKDRETESIIGIADNVEVPVVRIAPE